MWIHVSNKLLIDDDGCLFQAINFFDDLDVDISIFWNNSINMIKCSNVWWELFRVDSHILCSWHLEFPGKNTLYHMIKNLAPQCASKIVLLNSSSIPKEMLLGTTNHPDILTCHSLLLIWFWMVLISVGGNHIQNMYTWPCDPFVLLTF